MELNRGALLAPRIRLIEPVEADHSAARITRIVDRYSVDVDRQPRDIRCVGNLQLKRLTAGSGIAIVALHTKRATNGHGTVGVFHITARLVIRNLDGLDARLVGTHDLELRGRLDLAHRGQTFTAHKPRERQADD